jgi:choline-glycine betaine transporter
MISYLCLPLRQRLGNETNYSYFSWVALYSTGMGQDYSVQEPTYYQAC